MPDNQDNSAQIYKKLYRFFLEREIANFYEFLNTLDKVLSTRSQELSTKIGIADSDLEGIDINDERRNELINLEVEADQVKDFTNLLRQSFITSLFSFMELKLKRECHIDSKHRDGGKSYEIIITRKTGIECVKKYFSGVMERTYPFDCSQDWQWIINFQRLRNCIIHRQGSLTGFSDFEKDKILEKFVDSENGLSRFGVDNNQIFIEKEFCLKAMQTVHRFVLELLGLQ